MFTILKLYKNTFTAMLKNDLAAIGAESFKGEPIDLSKTEKTIKRVQKYGVSASELMLIDEVYEKEKGSLMSKNELLEHQKHIANDLLEEGIFISKDMLLDKSSFNALVAMVERVTGYIVEVSEYDKQVKYLLKEGNLYNLVLKRNDSGNIVVKLDNKDKENIIGLDDFKYKYNSSYIKYEPLSGEDMSGLELEDRVERELEPENQSEPEKQLKPEKQLEPEKQSEPEKELEPENQSEPEKELAIDDRPIANTKISIVDYLDNLGIISSKANRKKLAIEYGIKDYYSNGEITAKKNRELMNALIAGKKPDKQEIKSASKSINKNTPIIAEEQKEKKYFYKGIKLSVVDVKLLENKGIKLIIKNKQKKPTIDYSFDDDFDDFDEENNEEETSKNQTQYEFDRARGWSNNIHVETSEKGFLITDDKAKTVEIKDYKGSMFDIIKKVDTFLDNKERVEKMIVKKRGGSIWDRPFSGEQRLKIGEMLEELKINSVEDLETKTEELKKIL